MDIGNGKHGKVGFNSETFERVADQTLKVQGICGCDRLGFEGRIIAVFAFEGLEGMEIGQFD